MSKSDETGKNGERSLEALAAASVLAVVSRGAAVIVGGILVWGFSKIDRSLEEMNKNISGIQIVISRLEADRDGMKEKLNALDAHMSKLGQAPSRERTWGTLQQGQ